MNSIFIIDDSELDRDLCGIIIEQFDPQIQVHFAEDGLEALRKLTILTQNPDIILLDINMPVLDGFGFLRRYIGNNKTRVYIMVACEEQRGDIRRAAQFSCVAGHVIKPLNLDTLRVLRQQCVLA